MSISAPPWNAIGYTTMAFYPLVIGLTYLLSLDVSFSCWFFYLFTKVQNVGATAFGFRDPGAGPTLAHMPYIAEQGVGAFVGLALFSLWLARPHLADTWRKAFRGDRTMDDSDEPMSYRAAYLGLFASSLLLVGFGVALGLSLWVSLLFWAIFAAPAPHVHAHSGRGGPAVGTGAVGQRARYHGQLWRSRVFSRRTR